MVGQTPDLDKLIGECEFSYALSGGPGGQHANKVETKVELRFNIIKSGFLSEEQKRLLIQKAGQYGIDGGNSILIKSSGFRSKGQNRKEVIRKFEQWLKNALKQPKKRIATQIPESVKEKRVKSKRRNSALKQGRGNLKAKLSIK